MKYALISALTILMGLSACKKDDQGPDCSLTIDANARAFEFIHDFSGNTFVAWTTNAEVIADVMDQLALPLDQRNKHINGKIDFLPENCALNEPWSWYFVPNQWALAEFSIEVCDGNPRYVEENLDEFVNNVGRFCPWGSKVSREITLE